MAIDPVFRVPFETPDEDSNCLYELTYRNDEARSQLTLRMSWIEYVQIRECLAGLRGAKRNTLGVGMKPYYPQQREEEACQLQQR